MDFIEVATLTDQTFLITPRYASQVVRVGGVSHPTTGPEVPIRVFGSGVVELSEGYWDEMLIVDGAYGGPYFDGSLADTPTAEYAWTGTPDASTSTYRTGTVIPVEDPIAYAAKVESLTRYMHTTTAVSGPTIVQKMHRGEAWGYLVEFVLVSGVPWTFGVTKPVPGANNPTIPEIIQDIVFNLVPYPSAELALGSVVAATNYSTNPSLETNLTTWSKSTGGAVVAADAVLSRSDIGAGGLASVGTRSALLHFVATNTGASGVLSVEHAVSFPATAAGLRMSVNLWTNTLLVSGTAVIAGTQIFATWRTGTTQLRVDTIGTVPAGGGALTKKSIAVPVGADNVILRASTSLTSWSTGAVVDLYADAAAITVP